MALIYLLPAILFGALWGWIWFRIFKEAGYSSAGWLTALMFVPITAVPTVLWFLFREKPINRQRRAARVANGTATPNEVQRMLGYALSLEASGKTSLASDIYGQIGKGWPNTEEGSEASRRLATLAAQSD